MLRFSGISHLDISFNTQEFDCGNPALNDYLKKHALINHTAGSARTYVICEENTTDIVGYYSLTFGSVAHKDALPRAGRGLPKHPIPIILLSRLGVDTRAKGMGLGSALVKDAFMRAAAAADIAGLRAIVCHAKDEQLKKFYTKFGFEPWPLDSLHLWVLMKDVLASLRLPVLVAPERKKL